MTTSSEIPEEQWTPKLLRAHYAHPNDLRVEAGLRLGAGDDYSTRFGVALKEEADRWEQELKGDGTQMVALDPRPARELTTREVAKILGGNIGTLVECSDVATVRKAVTWLYSSEEFWKKLSG